jgi:hypothetical protein
MTTAAHTRTAWTWVQTGCRVPSRGESWTRVCPSIKIDMPGKVNEVTGGFPNRPQAPLTVKRSLGDVPAVTRGGQGMDGFLRELPGLGSRVTDLDTERSQRLTRAPCDT